MAIESGPESLYPHLEATILGLQETLRPMYIDDEVVKKLEGADCEIQGVRYFSKLFSNDPEVTLEQRLTSAYLGATAYGDEQSRDKAYRALYGMQTIPDVRSLFIQEVDNAIKRERRVPNYTHLSRLEAATKELGKPVIKRALGNLATLFIARSYAN